jgi:cytoskeletal protein CcmA (bactofilin family)
MTIRQWSTTASGNSNVSGINFSEGQNPSTVNNSARETLAQIRQEYTPERWGWVACSATASVNSQTVFKLTGNQASDYVANRKVKLTGGSTTLYATIVSSSFTTETTITITGASGSLSSSMSIAWLSTVYTQNLPANVVVTSGTSTFTAEAVFQATASFASAVKVSGTLSVGGNIVAGGSVTVGGSATFSGTVAMLTALNVSGTLNVGTLLVGGVAVGGGGWSLIGSTAIGAAQTSEVKFSGSWSQYVAFKVYIVNMGSSASGTALLKIYTDGGTTPILTLPNQTLAANIQGDYDIMGSGQSLKLIKHHASSVTVYAITTTANSGIINCIGWTTSGGTVTISGGSVVLYGMKG